MNPRDIDPDFTAFVDELTAVFGKVRVRHVKTHDGSAEVGRDPLAGATLISSDAWKQLGTFKDVHKSMKQWERDAREAEEQWKRRNGHKTRGRR